MEDTGKVLAEAGGYVLIEGRGWVLEPEPEPEPEPAPKTAKPAKS